jgi:hypothetical protein
MARCDIATHLDVDLRAFLDLNQRVPVELDEWKCKPAAETYGSVTSTYTPTAYGSDYCGAHVYLNKPAVQCASDAAAAATLNFISTSKPEVYTQWTAADTIVYAPLLKPTTPTYEGRFQLPASLHDKDQMDTDVAKLLFCSERMVNEDPNPCRKRKVRVWNEEG